ncbi:MAG: hypothetical protein CVV21_08000 [Candidatus Goldiibacteriota bacterium HGW-Goldbacteria-1]|jgi:hypothetical protein|nr:MAG: hypothetical protein CVV21_08000 [Candidatus Goldiibacteriota bacterium HGW-Goldbacteria-1]
MIFLLAAAYGLYAADKTVSVGGITKEEYLVFAAAAEYIMADSSWKSINTKYFMLNNITEKNRFAVADDKLYSFISRYIKDLTREIYTDYMLKNDKEYLVEQKIPLKSKYVLLKGKPAKAESTVVDEEINKVKLKISEPVDLSRGLSVNLKLTDIKNYNFEAEKLRLENGKKNKAEEKSDGWAELYKEHPGASGIAIFSRCGFSKDGNTVLIFVLNQFDGTGGKGSYLLMKKKYGKWVVTSETVVYVS